MQDTNMATANGGAQSGTDGASVPGPAAGDATDLRLLELMCSRLCHDLISPVSAIRSGVELMTEFAEAGAATSPGASPGAPAGTSTGAAADDEVVGLIAGAANQAADKLSFFRVAYGQSGTRATNLSFADAAKLLAPMVTSPRVSLDWPVEQQPTSPLPGPGAIKLVLNLGLLALEALPRGGILRLTITPAQDRLELRILAEAEDARLKDELLAALNGDTPIDELTPRAGHAVFTKRVAERLQCPMDIVSDAPGGITFAVSLPVL